MIQSSETADGRRSSEIAGAAMCRTVTSMTTISSAAQSTAFLQTADDQLGEASALWNIGRQISFCLGVALLSVLLNLLLGLDGITDPGDPAMSVRATHVFHLCFAIAATSAVLPILLCMRIGNADILRRLRMQPHPKTQP